MNDVMLEATRLKRAKRLRQSNGAHSAHAWGESETVMTVSLRDDITLSETSQ